MIYITSQTLFVVIVISDVLLTSCSFPLVDLLKQEEKDVQLESQEHPKKDSFPHVNCAGIYLDVINRALISNYIQ